MPSKERVRIVHDFSLPVERVFAFVSDHDNLDVLFAPAKIARIRNGTDGTPNGSGSVRSLKLAPFLPPIEETNTNVVPNELIEYAITRGSPLTTGHWGRIVFEPRPQGSRVTYTIGLNAKLPGLARLVGRILTSKIRKGLRKVDRLA